MHYGVWFIFDLPCLFSNALRLFIAFKRHSAGYSEAVLLIFCGFKPYFLIWRQIPLAIVRNAR
ncbi:hypothetical protein [Pectobacterium cacticida]|uniref:Uncharacterized protein n=1 Tax=Pectobacterium cacticida TaxID=69221 RepID=A0ABZ2GDW4_9GAMM